VTTDPTRAITTGQFLDDGTAVYHTWYVTPEQHRAIVGALGEPDVERFQTAEELAASNALVDTFETPPLERS
jgi:hypothetical protein